MNATRASPGVSVEVSHLHMNSPSDPVFSHPRSNRIEFSPKPAASLRTIRLKPNHPSRRRLQRLSVALPEKVQLNRHVLKGQYSFESDMFLNQPNLFDS